MSNFVVISDSVPGVRVVTLSRPEKKNALTREMYDALADALKPPTQTGMCGSSA